MSQSTDLIVDAVNGKPLAMNHQAATFAARLPSWHPVRRLLTGPSQWLGRINAVYCLLGLFSVLYDGQLRQAAADGILDPDAGPPDVDAERAHFLRLFPDDVLYQGRHDRLHRIYAAAREEIETLTGFFPPLRTEALADFDTTFAKLVRAVRWS